MLRVGDGSTLLSGAAAPMFIDEYATDGTAVHTGDTTATGNPLPTSSSGSNARLVASGNAALDGLMTLSADGQYLVLAGYDAAIGTASVASASGIDRVVGRVDWNGNMDTSTRIPSSEGYIGNNIRGAASVDGTAFWTSGAGNSGSGGVRYTTLGAASGSIQISTSPTDTRALGIYNGQLYVSAATTGFFGVCAVGTGLPTTSGQTVGLLPGFPTASGPSSCGFVFADPSTLYVADTRSNVAGGVQKWTFGAGAWTLQYTLNNSTTISVRDIVGDFSGTDPILYVTTGEATANRIVKIVDKGTSSSTFTTLATAPASTTFHGLAWAPTPVNQPPVNTLPSAFAATEDTAKFLTGISVADPDAGGANIKVTFSIPAGTGSLTIKTDVSGGVTGSQITNGGNGTETVEITAPAAAINATLADAGGFKYTPAANLNSNTNGGDVILTMVSNDLGNTGNGGAKTDTDTSAIAIAPVADSPSVTDATTNEDTQSGSGLVISRNAADGSEVTHFKITAITNGTLYQHDGTTPIHDGDFIAVADGGAGLKFTPAPDFFGAASFKVQASVGNTDGGLGGGQATATVTVNPVPDLPSVTSAATDEDVQSTSGLIISRNSADGSEVTHFKITAITNGTLFKNDGTTPVHSGDFITVAEGNAGLKFTPLPDFFGTGSFQVQASLSNSDSGLGGGLATATITVNPVADTPSVTGTTTVEDSQSTSGLVVSRNAADGAEVTHFKITAITNGSLFKNDGTTSIHSGDFISFAEGNAGLKFTPAPDFFGTASFQVQAALSDSDSGLGGGLATATITVNPAADTPSVTDASTKEDTQSTSGLVISRNAADGTEVTHFKITAIANGTLFKNDGTTPIQNGDFITFAEGNAGLKFTPATHFVGTGSFQVQASLSNSDSGLGGSLATATITVGAVPHTPVVTDATTDEDAQSASGLVISRNALDGSAVSHFKITGITNGSLFKNDGTTEIHNGDFITFAEGNAGLKFTPLPDFFGTGSFAVQASLSDSDGGLGGGLATATIHVNPVADTPSVTGTSTNEDAQSTSGLIVSRNPADGSEVTHFKITGIANGTLFQNDGTTPIANGGFITAAEGSAGLKFTPDPDFNGTVILQVQSSLTGDDSGLGGGLAAATIIVHAVNDAPVNTLPASFSATEDTSANLDGISLSDIDAGGAAVRVTLSVPAGAGTLTVRPDVAGGVDAGQIAGNGTDSVVITAPLDAINATLADPTGLVFQPAADLFGDVLLTMLTDDRGNTGLGGSLTDTDTATITIAPVADTPSVTSATTNEDEQSADGLVISRNASDGSEVTYFQITGIQHGTLYLNDGATVVHDGDFVAVSDGLAGLRFTPDRDYFGQGSFNVRASTGNDVTGLGGSAVTATIDVRPVADTPSVTDATTNEDVQTTDGLLVARNPVDGAEVSHFQITNIASGTLYLIDGTTVIHDGDFITVEQGNAGLRFTPAPDFFGTASFDLRASIGADPSGLGGSAVTAYIAVDAVADQPSVTDTTTDEDTPTASGLVITPNPVDGSSVTHFQITAIINGTLYESDGVTPVNDGDFVSVADGAAGLVFRPAADYFGSASFDVRTATSASVAGLGGAPAIATITIHPVNDAPTLDPVADVQIDEDASEQLINLTGITVGPANEALAGQTIISVTATSDNHALMADPAVDFDPGTGAYRLRFTPVANANGVAHVTVTVRDDGGTDRGGVDAVTKSSTVLVNPMPDAPILDAFLIPMLPAVPLRTIPDGTPVSHLVEKVSDYDTADPRGVAIVGLDTVLNKKPAGVWQFSTDGGAVWTDVPADVSPGSAFLLGDSPDTRVRFLPTRRFNGYVSIQYRAWDQSQGQQFDRADTTVAGNTTFSTSIERAWVAVGRARPRVDGNGNTVLPPVKEDARRPRAVRAAKVLGLAAKEQASSKGLGVALVAADTPDGKWQYRLARTKDWVDVGTVSRTSALLLRPNDSLRFVANPNADGDATLAFKTWDAKAETAGTRVDPAGTGFSVDGGSAILDIIAVNDAPVLALPTTPPTLDPIAANQTSSALLLSSIMTAADVEGANIGVAIVGAKGHGGWQYSTDGGTTWLTVAASSTRPLFLDADTLVRFTADSSTRKSTAALSFKAWDRTVNGRGRPLPSSVSKLTEVLTVEVN